MSPIETQFSFRSLSGPSSATEAIIFIHGYSAGHNEKDRQKLIDSIPDSISNFTNIFVFWRSSHFTRFDGDSQKKLAYSVRNGLAQSLVTLGHDRAEHFRRSRSKAECMGEQLPEQLNNYLRSQHPGIDTISLLGHSLGGRLVVSSLKKLALTSGYRLAINDVLLMAAAVEVKPDEAQRMRSLVKGRLINAYSKEDRILHMNFGESSLGRNAADHFENIRIPNFGHSDYWKKLPEVLARTEFKSTVRNTQPQKHVVAETGQASPSAQPIEAQTMAFVLNTPSDIYQHINGELVQIVASLNTLSSDATLSQAQKDASALLTQHQSELQTLLTELEKNAEWSTFTIAFYGETGAGKSTIIETLRILLREPSKLASQQAFREMKSRYGLCEENLQQLQHAIEQNDVWLSERAQQLNAIFQQHEQLHSDSLSTITRLQSLIAKHKQTASLWKKLLNLFRKTPEEKALARAEQELPNVVDTRDKAIAPLLSQQVAAEKSKLALEQQLQESEKHLAELHALADGEIIGDGRTDFTRRTQRYDFKLDGQSFALLDVPGIEGNEGLVLSEIEQAVQTAHAVFYVTNQAAPPQTGSEQRKGTLEKIKAHLGAQTEVWTIFNKKITSPKYSLSGRPLTSDDENTSLTGLDEKMREQLGKHYRKVFSLTALPAFLASTDHFAPNSLNARRRTKVLADFSPEDLLDKSCLRSFVRLLSDQLLSDSQAKITRANFYKATEALEQAARTLGRIQRNFAELSEKLGLDGLSAQVQLNGSFSALKQRVESSSETLIYRFASNVRREIYDLIQNEISNDYFKDALKDSIEKQQEILTSEFPKAMSHEIERFQQDAESILQRFQEQANELTDIYAKLNSIPLIGKFSLKLDLNNGLQVTNLLTVLAGALMLLWNPVGWYLGALGVLTLVLGTFKAVRGFFSSDYQKAEQRKSTDDNLRLITKQLHDSLLDGRKSAMPDIQQKISLLEQILAEPAKQAGALARLLEQSANQLTALSSRIKNTGNL